MRRFFPDSQADEKQRGAATTSSHDQTPIAPFSSTADAMATAPSTSVVEERDGSAISEISVGQRMLSATTGSVLISLLGAQNHLVTILVLTRYQSRLWMSFVSASSRNRNPHHILR